MVVKPIVVVRVVDAQRQKNFAMHDHEECKRANENLHCQLDVVTACEYNTAWKLEIER